MSKLHGDRWGHGAEVAEAWTGQAMAALKRAGQLVDGPLGYRPELAAEIEQSRRNLAAGLADLQIHRSDPIQLLQHLKFLRNTVEEVRPAVRNAPPT
jgi:hypothetical protein